MENTERLYSTKQIADILGVTKIKVYRCIKSECINSVSSETVKGNTVMMYDSKAFTRVSEVLKGTSYSVSKSVTNSVSDSISDETPPHDFNVQFIGHLERNIEQLEKDKEFLKQQLEAEQQAHRADNERLTTLLAMERQRVKQLEEKNTPQTPPETDVTAADEEPHEQKRGLFKRLFVKKMI
jgi:hypothetical protein